MATPVVAKNKSRIWKKIIAVLTIAAQEADKPIGDNTANRAMSRVWVSAGVPSGGTGVASGDFCLDYSTDDVYRYYDAWYKLSVEA